MPGCRCPELAAFSGELKSRTQELAVLQHLPACAPSLQHLLLSACEAISDRELWVAALGAIILACRLLQSVNICLQGYAYSSVTSSFKQVPHLPVLSWRHLVCGNAQLLTSAASPADVNMQEPVQCNPL